MSAFHASSSINGFTLACPRCGAPVERNTADAVRCPQDGSVYRRVDGIWRFLAPERLTELYPFIREYETVRQAEGRGMDDPAYYRALPFRDKSGRFATDWRIRAKSFQALIKQVVIPMEGKRAAPLQVLDLGAGNGWLANRLALRGHHVAAIDLLTNSYDGLGAYRHYRASLSPIQAEFNALPLAPKQADLAIFNGSLHYAPDYEMTLAEALRVLRAEGRLVIMDSPVYHDPHSGEQMVQEREARFRQAYGFPSNVLGSENYVTFDRLDELARRLDLAWQLYQPFYGWRWALRPWKARLLGRREPATFLLAVGRRDTKQSQRSNL